MKVTLSGIFHLLTLNIYNVQINNKIYLTLFVVSFFINKHQSYNAVASSAVAADLGRCDVVALAVGDAHTDVRRPHHGGLVGGGLQLAVHIQTRRVLHRLVPEGVQTAERETEVRGGHDLVMVL